MPNIENLTQNSFTKSPTINVHRNEILHRTDLKVGFGYALTGLGISLAVAGIIYVVGKQLLK